MSQTLTFAIANLALELTIHDEAYASLLKEHWKEFLSEEEPIGRVEVIVDYDIPIVEEPRSLLEISFNEDVISVKRNVLFVNYDFSTNKGSLKMAFVKEDPFWLVKDFFLFVWSVLLLNKKVLVFHSSAIELNNKGYFFAGHSGSGKTTIADKFPVTNVINDETIAISLDSKPIIFSTPFTGITYTPKNKHVPFRTGFFLEKNKPLAKRKLTQKEAFLKLAHVNRLFQFFFNRSSKYQQMILSLLTKLSKEGSFYILQSQQKDDINSLLN